MQAGTKVVILTDCDCVKGETGVVIQDRDLIPSLASRLIRVKLDKYDGIRGYFAEDLQIIPLTVVR